MKWPSSYLIALGHLALMLIPHTHLFKLPYINYTRGFIVIFPYMMHMMYFDLIHPLYYSFLSPYLPFKTLLTVFNSLSSYMYMKFFNDHILFLCFLEYYGDLVLNPSIHRFMHFFVLPIPQKCWNFSNCCPVLW
jgi:hypothetical protein